MATPGDEFMLGYTDREGRFYLAGIRTAAPVRFMYQSVRMIDLVWSVQHNFILEILVYTSCRAFPRSGARLLSFWRPKKTRNKRGLAYHPPNCGVGASSSHSGWYDDVHVSSVPFTFNTLQACLLPEQLVPSFVTASCWQVLYEYSSSQLVTIALATLTPGVFRWTLIYCTRAL